MREYTDLSRKFHENIFQGGTKNIILPLCIPFTGKSEKLVYECSYAPPYETEQNEFFLEISSLSGDFEIFCNGNSVISGSTVFARYRTRLTDFIEQNTDNIIRLEITPKARPDGNFAFNGAKLIMTPKTHFELLSDGDTGLTVHTVINGDTAHITAKAEIVGANNYDVAVFTLFDPKGRVVEIRNEKPTDASTDFIVPAPVLWDGPHSPALYTVEVTIIRDSTELDKTVHSFGIRSFEIGRDGFFLLNGIKNPICGISLTDFSAIEDDFEYLSLINANCIRITGLPSDENILTLCDDAGILLWINLPCTESDADIDELRAFAKCCARHPSVAVLETAVGDIPFAKQWYNTVKQYAPFTSVAFLSDIMNSESILDAIPDVLCIHIPATTGLSDFHKLENAFSEKRDSHPDFRFGVFADSPECIFDRHTVNAVRSDCSQEYFSLWHEGFWNTFGTQRNVVGIIPANLSDRGEKSERAGLITKDREEIKDAFWYYRAQFSVSDFIKLCSAEQTLVTSKYTDVKCYTNAKHIKLTINGKESKKYTAEKLSDAVYVFRGVKLKRHNNIIVVSTESSTDSEVIYRSRSKLSKK